MRVFRGSLFSRTLAAAEIAMNAAALVACWYVAARLLSWGRASLRAAGDPPASLAAAWEMVGPDLPARALDLGGAAAALAASAVLGYSAAEGTWWLLRRLARG